MTDDNTIDQLQAKLDASLDAADAEIMSLYRLLTRADAALSMSTHWDICQPSISQHFPGEAPFCQHCADAREYVTAVRARISNILQKEAVRRFRSALDAQIGPA
jgi:hypothetical protein